MAGELRGDAGLFLRRWFGLFAWLVCLFGLFDWIAPGLGCFHRLVRWRARCEATRQGVVPAAMAWVVCLACLFGLFAWREPGLGFPPPGLRWRARCEACSGDVSRCHCAEKKKKERKEKRFGKEQKNIKNDAKRNNAPRLFFPGSALSVGSGFGGGAATAWFGVFIVWFKVVARCEATRHGVVPAPAAMAWIVCLFGLFGVGPV